LAVFDCGNLPTFDCSELKTFETDGLAAVIESHRDVRVELPENYVHRRRPTRIETRDLRGVANAAKHLERLPEPGETFHAVTRGNYQHADIIPAVLTLAGPSARFARVDVATLGFSAKNAADFLDWIDRGLIGRLYFLASAYFRSMKDGGDVYEAFAAQLLSRPGGHRIAACRSHVKLIGMELSDGRAFVVESSANLRSCRTIEQFTMTADRGVLEFHRAWMREVLNDANS